MENNILYDDKDVTVKIIGDDSLDDFLADAEKKVQKKKASYRVKPKKEKGKEDIPEPRGSIWDYPCGNSLYDYYV